ncbi:unnamed protein product [Cuscuta campestris]|uniref:Uncharacterized protein n=1 Tax=Cuscuta campestris TaxID=132261 RepID=A0A484ND01_9ASTE|nr:unnamed protein product [Cuscuta campestris]
MAQISGVVALSTKHGFRKTVESILSQYLTHPSTGERLKRIDQNVMKLVECHKSMERNSKEVGRQGGDSGSVPINGSGSVGGADEEKKNGEKGSGGGADEKKKNEDNEHPEKALGNAFKAGLITGTTESMTQISGVVASSTKHGFRKTVESILSRFVAHPSMGERLERIDQNVMKLLEYHKSMERNSIEVWHQSGGGSSVLINGSGSVGGANEEKKNGEKGSGGGADEKKKNGDDGCGGGNASGGGGMGGGGGKQPSSGHNGENGASIVPPPLSVVLETFII